MKPEEMINLALQEEIEVEVLKEIPRIELFGCAIGGSKELQLSRMPLYIALHLQGMGYCSVKVPVYLAKEFVSDLLEREQASKSFIELPMHFFEMARLLMPNGIDGEILELKRIRQSKIWQGLSSLDGRALCINGLTRWEFNECRDVILGAMKTGHMIEKDNISQ